MWKEINMQNSQFKNREIEKFTGGVGLSFSKNLANIALLNPPSEFFSERSSYSICWLLGSLLYVGDERKMSKSYHSNLKITFELLTASMWISKTRWKFFLKKKIRVRQKVKKTENNIIVFFYHTHSLCLFLILLILIHVRCIWISNFRVCYLLKITKISISII